MHDRLTNTTSNPQVCQHDFYLLRHGRTLWNQQGRIQGRFDAPLLATTIRELQQQTLGTWCHTAHWHCSPLKRARHTAEALGCTHYCVHDDLQEMHWGEFEGLTRQDLPHVIAQLPAEQQRGLNFQPPQGESPRQVRQRVLHWLQDIASKHPNDSKPHCIITHKGVIRSVFSAACDWDMWEDYPQKIDYNCWQRFTLSNSTLRLTGLNIALCQDAIDC